MPTLKENPVIADFHAYLKESDKERGFENETSVQQCLLLGEEIGELFRAVRRTECMKTDANSRIAEVSDELADVFIYILAIANQYNINLEEAFRKKEEINKKRVWK